MDVANRFQGLNNAQTFEKGVPLTPGLYTAEIKKVLAKTSRQSGDLLIVELGITETSNDAHPKGSKRSWIQKLQNPDVAFPAVLAWLYAASGVDHQKDPAAAEQIRGAAVDLMDKACSDGQPFTGRKVKIQVDQVMTKKNTPFTRYTFSPA